MVKQSHIRNILLSGSCLLAVGLFIAPPAQAADFTIVDGQTVTTNQALNGAGQTGLIEHQAGQ